MQLLNTTSFYQTLHEIDPRLSENQWHDVYREYYKFVVWKTASISVAAGLTSMAALHAMKKISDSLSKDIPIDKTLLGVTAVLICGSTVLIHNLYSAKFHKAVDTQNNQQVQVTIVSELGKNTKKSN